MEPSDSLVAWFWNSLESFTCDEKILFMRFVSGRSRLPANLADITQRFQIVRSDRVSRLPLHPPPPPPPLPFPPPLPGSRKVVESEILIPGLEKSWNLVKCVQLMKKSLNFVSMSLREPCLPPLPPLPPPFPAPAVNTAVFTAVVPIGISIARNHSSTFLVKATQSP